MSNEGNHVCVLCNTKLETKDALRDHFRKHANREIDVKGRKLKPSGEVEDIGNSKVYIKGTASQIGTNITCDVCGERFTCNTRAIQHKFRKHPYNAAKHYCPQCGMQFPLKGHRDKHVEEEHGGTGCAPEEPFPCYQCGAVFYTQQGYEYHDKSAHHRVVTLYKQIETPPPTKKIRYNNAGEPHTVYYCHLCGFEYIVKFNLQKHLERQHSRAERGAVPAELLRCNTCDGLFYNQKAYHNHTMYHRPDDLYVTSEEQRLATVKRVDQDFDIRRVAPAAERYLPRYRRSTRRSVPSTTPSVTVEDDELSPASEADDSDEEPAAKVPKVEIVSLSESAEEEEITATAEEPAVAINKVSESVSPEPSVSATTVVQ